MSAHTRGPRKRTRKSHNGAVGGPPADAHSATAPRGASAGSRERDKLGERPKAPWHPLPLSELLILAGGVGAAVAVLRGPAHNGLLLLIGIGALALGSLEVSWREHRGGFRSHAMLLAVLPVVVLHTAVVLIVGVFTTPPRALTVGFLAVDAALFWFLLRLLRLSFSEARVKRR